MDAPNDPTVILWNADALFLTGDYAHAVSVLDGNRTAILAVRVGGLQTNLYRFRDLYIRSQVRLKNFVAARAEANLNPGAADVKDWWHIAIVECAAGNVADATQAMDAWLKDGVDEVDESDLEHDPDIGPCWRLHHSRRGGGTTRCPQHCRSSRSIDCPTRRGRPHDRRCPSRKYIEDLSAIELAQ